MPPKIVQSARWNAADYAANSTVQQTWARELIARLKLGGDEHILDVGCGDGKVTAEIARALPRGSVTGMDASPQMIEFAKKTFPASAFPNMRFRVMDARKIKFDRQFDFSSNQNIFPSIVERLRGTPVRLEEKFRSIPAALLTRSVDGGWSIKENLGHLSDLEPLWQQRLEDIVMGRTELSPTDLANRRTSEAGHDLVSVEELLHRFREVRAKTIDLLEVLDEATVFKYALHPRLKTPMRTMDLFLFVADHDDHHLARITELSRLPV